jgi:hypothetical protein
MGASMMTKDDMKLGGPGLDGYIYNADVLCTACAHAVIDALPRERYTDLEAGDSEVVPVPVFFGESDFPQHCGECGMYLYGEAEDGYDGECVDDSVWEGRS